MVKKRCACCNGSGKVMGGGMMMHECDDCEGRGRIYVNAPEAVQIDKEKPEYKSAIKKIKKLDPKISYDEAEVIFEKAWKENK